MNTAKSYLSATLGLVMLASIIAFSLPQTGHSSAAAAAGEKDVRVVNTAAEAVPVAILGTPGVNITNSPTVQVGNGTSNPVMVRDVDRHAREPFQFEVAVAGSLGATIMSDPMPIPAGKIAVIENISAFGKAPPNQRLQIGVLTRLAPDTSYRFHRLNFTAVKHPLVETAPTEYTVSQMVKIYCDSPEFFARVTRFFEGGEDGPLTFNFVVSGYFVDEMSPGL